MSKTSSIGRLAGVTLFVGVALGLAAPHAGAMSRASAKAAETGLNTWDGQRSSPFGATVVGADDVPTVATPAWDEGLNAEAARAPGDFVVAGGASDLANLDPDADNEALPIGQFAGAGAKSAASHSGFGVRDFVNRVRYGRLPEPASWGLMLIGFGMIGGALRGFVVANRRLARLQPEDGA